MSGHSKWSTIKHKKARSDEKKGKEFTKLAKEITIAVQTGGGTDPESNAKLKLAIQKAKAINMPNENINRALKKGSGYGGGDILEEFVYEGYAPGGVAIMLQITTDNRNRTASDIRHLFSKNNGSLGETGCVAWMFKRAGVIQVPKEGLQQDEEDLMILALDYGADDITDEGDYYEIIASPEMFMEVKEGLETKQIYMSLADFQMLPENSVEINSEDMAVKILNLIDVLDDHEDVQSVYSNMNVSDDFMEKLA